MLDTDQLRSFIAIVQTGSFTRAARSVNKTQSAVSMHIRRLEERLGRPLFVKIGRSSVLSSDGERLVEHARRILRAEADALLDLRQGRLDGRITLGIPDDYADTFLPEIVRRFTALHPSVELSIACRPSLTLAADISTGEVDIALVTSCGSIKGVEELRAEPLRWIASRKRAEIEQQRPLPLVVSSPTCPWRTAALDALNDAGLPWRIYMVSSNYAAIAPIVQAGLALTVLPQGLVDLKIYRVVNEKGLPKLPLIRAGLLAGTASETREAKAMADVIRACMFLPDVEPQRDQRVVKRSA